MKQVRQALDDEQTRVEARSRTNTKKTMSFIRPDQLQLKALSVTHEVAVLNEDIRYQELLQFSSALSAMFDEGLLRG